MVRRRPGVGRGTYIALPCLVMVRRRPGVGRGTYIDLPCLVRATHRFGVGSCGELTSIRRA